jgi:hypothetical protein
MSIATGRRERSLRLGWGAGGVSPPVAAFCSRDRLGLCILSLVYKNRRFHRDNLASFGNTRWVCFCNLRFQAQHSPALEGTRIGKSFKTQDNLASFGIFDVVGHCAAPSQWVCFAVLSVATRKIV